MESGNFDMSGTAQQLLAEARQSGAHITLAGNRIRVRATAPPPGLIERLRARKPELVAVLRREQSAGWDAETARLIAWFVEARPPARPFELMPGVTVMQPARWWTSIHADIAEGPRGPRARWGALQANLRRACRVSGAGS